MGFRKNRGFPPPCVPWHPSLGSHTLMGRLQATVLALDSFVALKAWAEFVDQKKEPWVEALRFKFRFLFLPAG